MRKLGLSVGGGCSDIDVCSSALIHLPRMVGLSDWLSLLTISALLPMWVLGHRLQDELPALGWGGFSWTRWYILGSAVQ